MKIAAIVSAKGGVGKSTLAANLAVALQHRQQAPVLAVDLDPQNALRLHFGLDPHGLGGLARATLRGQNWLEAIEPSPSGVRLLPYGALNDTDQQRFEAHLESHPDWLGRQLLRMALPAGTLVVLDTPPGASLYVRQALACAHVAVVVALPDAASYATLPQMERLIQAHAAARPGFLGQAYVLNQVDSSRQLSRDVAQVMRATLGERLMGQVHQDPSVSEALACGTNVIDHAAASQATLDLLGCAQRLAARLDGARETR